MPLTFSIIVVNYNNEELLPSCLRSVREAGRGVAHETVVANNASQPPALSDEFPSTRVIQNDGNLGWGKAVNRAAKLCTGELLLLLNPDAELFPDSLQVLRAFFERRAGQALGAVGGKLLFPDGRWQPSCGPFPHLGNLLWRLGLPPERRKYYMRPSAHAPMAVDWVTGAFFAVRRSLFEELGGLDEDFFLYYEEVDFCLRAAKRGFQSFYVPQAIAYHHRPYASRRNAAPELKKVVQNSRVRYFKKNRPPWESWTVAKLSRLERLS